MPSFRRSPKTTALLAGVLLGLSGCASLGYYWQSVSGHLQLMNAARPIDDWLQDSETPDKLKARLALTRQIRRFAVSELKLPDNASYQRYADLRRKAVVWNVSAAPEFSLTLHTWCFPVTGCVGYKGYFDEAQARAEADKLSAQGLEVSVYGVPAYSTPGWMNWAKRFVFLPRWPEPQGRVVIEAALCGCELALNGQVGAASFDFDLKDPKNLTGAEEEFWLALEALP